MDKSKVLMDKPKPLVADSRMLLTNFSDGVTFWSPSPLELERRLVIDCCGNKKKTPAAVTPKVVKQVKPHYMVCLRLCFLLLFFFMIGFP